MVFDCAWENRILIKSKQKKQSFMMESYIGLSVGNSHVTWKLIQNYAFMQIQVFPEGSDLSASCSLSRRFAWKPDFVHLQWLSGTLTMDLFKRLCEVLCHKGCHMFWKHWLGFRNCWMPVIWKLRQKQHCIMSTRKQQIEKPSSLCCWIYTLKSLSFIDIKVIYKKVIKITNITCRGLTRQLA